MDDESGKDALRQAAARGHQQHPQTIAEKFSQYVIGDVTKVRVVLDELGVSFDWTPPDDSQKAGPNRKVLQIAKRGVP